VNRNTSYPTDCLTQVAYSAETALAYSVGAYWKGLANSGMTDEERRLLDPASEEYGLRYEICGNDGSWALADIVSQSRWLQNTGYRLVGVHVSLVDDQSRYVLLLFASDGTSRRVRRDEAMANVLGAQEGLEFRMRIYVGFGLIVSTWIAVLGSILFGCYPLEKNWQIYPDPGSKSPAVAHHNWHRADLVLSR